MDAEELEPSDAEGGEESPPELLRQLRSTYGPAIIEAGGPAAGLFALLGHVGLFERRCRNPVLVASAASGAELLALARRADPGFASRPRGLEPIGLELAARSTNELLAHGALPLFVVSQVTLGEADPPAVAAQVVRGVAKGCRQADCALLKAAVVRGPGELQLAAFAVGMVERARLLDGRRMVRPGDAVLGLAASGLQGCGLGPARRALFEQGGLGGADQPPGLGGPLAEELLRPSRTYARAVRALLERYRVKGVVHAIVPVGRGGLVGSLGAALGRGCVARIRREALPRPPALDVVRRAGGLSDEEMFGTFNMGLGLAAVVAPFYAEAALRRIRKAGERAVAIGEIVQGDGPAVEVV